MRCRLKDFVSGAMAALMFRGAKIIYANLIKGIIGNNPKFGPKLQFLYLKPILSTIFEILP